MSFNQDEYNLLISDKRTVISFSNNDGMNGASSRWMQSSVHTPSFSTRRRQVSSTRTATCPTSLLNKSARVHDVVVVGICFALKQQGRLTTYACETKCGVSICADTYMRFVSNQRVAKVDIPSTTGETMARAVETKPTLTFGGAIPEASPPPVVKTLVFGGIPKEDQA